MPFAPQWTGIRAPSGSCIQAQALMRSMAITMAPLTMPADLRCIVSPVDRSNVVVDADRRSDAPAVGRSRRGAVRSPKCNDCVRKCRTDTGGMQNGEKFFTGFDKGWSQNDLRARLASR